MVKIFPKYVSINITSVILDNPGASNYTASGTSISVTNFAIGNNPNRMLVAAVTSYNATTDPSSVTFGAQNLVQLTKTIFAGGAMWIYYLVAPTVSSSTSVTANFGGTNNYGISAVSYYNTIQSSSAFGTPVSTTQNTASPITNNVTTTKAGSVVFSCLQFNWSVIPTSPAPSAPLTIRGAFPATPAIASADQPASSIGTYTNTWTWTNGNTSTTEISVEIMTN